VYIGRNNIAEEQWPCVVIWAAHDHQIKNDSTDYLPNNITAEIMVQVFAPVSDTDNPGLTVARIMDDLQRFWKAQPVLTEDGTRVDLLFNDGNIGGGTLSENTDEYCVVEFGFFALFDTAKPGLT
jgi:hypothetical protein